jgi:glycosidase
MAHDTPASLRGASIYQVFVRNYSQEGTFDAALPALDAAVRMGFDIVCLTPIHPVGKVARKGTLGSPYAVADYRTVESSLGGEAGFRRFLDAAHGKGLKVLIDIVYNHTSPDSVLAHEHPEWFWKGPDGKPCSRVPEWSDVVDLDYSNAGLREYQIETLEGWARFGADGFRCDVASLVPVDFWVEARRRCAAIRDCLWLAESVHKNFLRDMRRRGFYAACDAELHEAFDITYDYDGREELDTPRASRKPLPAYLHHLYLQECMYPATAIKARFLENHDLPRAARRFGKWYALKNWTAFAMLLPGTFFAYAGEELSIEEQPSLFEKESVPWAKGDREFEAWFTKAHLATKAIRAREPLFDVREIAAGIVLVERRGGEKPVAALFNLEGHSGLAKLPFPIRGTNILSGEHVDLKKTIDIPGEPIVVELEHPAAR